MPPDPAQLVLLATARTEFEGRAMASALEAEGIPVEVFAAAATMVAWDGGYANMAKVMVPREHLARAVEAVRNARQASRAIDWSQVDVGVSEEDAPADGRDGERIAGLSPWLWRVRIFGFSLMAGSFMVAQTGPKMALPALILAVVFTFAADPGRPTRPPSPPGPPTTVRS